MVLLLLAPLSAAAASRLNAHKHKGTRQLPLCIQANPAPVCVAGARVINTRLPMVCVCTRTAKLVRGWKPR